MKRRHKPSLPHPSQMANLSPNKLLLLFKKKIVMKKSTEVTQTTPRISGLRGRYLHLNLNVQYKKKKKKSVIPYYLIATKHDIASR